MPGTIEVHRTQRGTFVGVPADEASVGEVMHPGVISCAPEAPARYAAKLMAAHDVHCVVVRGDDEEGGLWGVVSDTDLLPLITRGELDQHNAGAIARTPLVSIGRSESVASAAHLMSEYRVNHLLVVVRDRPIGVVSTLDLARATAEGLRSPAWSSARATRG